MGRLDWLNLPKKFGAFMNEPFGVIWDLDGTLADTGELHYQSWCRLARELGKEYTREQFSATFGMRNPEIIPRVFGTGYAAQEIADLGFRKEEYYRQEARNGIELIPGARTLIEQLHRAGVRQAIGSSTPRANVDLLLELTGLRTFFPAVVTLEDTSRGKPDPEVFLTAANRLEIPPKRCTVLEDAPAGIQAARAAGMIAIGVTFVGYHSRESLQSAGAHRVVPDWLAVTVEEILAKSPTV